MKHELEFKGFEPTPAIRELIEQRLERLERKARASPISRSLCALRGGGNSGP
jgi:ribosome-associated translation inhibitor RaiA